MKIYFDDIESLTSSNCNFLSKTETNNYWLTSPGTRIKQELNQLGIDYYKLSELTESGIYFVEVNGDPIWWCGVADGVGVPTKHILRELPSEIIDLVKTKNLKIIISADREGGSMLLNNKDCFQATYDAITDLNIPPDSILIIQGNKKIEKQYKKWLNYKNLKKIFNVQYSNHFNRIFIQHNFPTAPIALESIKNSTAKDYNSLNRTYKDHRSAHLYYIAKLNILNQGLVSANELRFNQRVPIVLLNESITELEYDELIQQHYPRYVDGNWAIDNAANSVNLDIFTNSLISFITETKFNEDVVFLTEKVYKTLTYGHPMIVLGPCGTLKALQNLGYKTNWCGIDPSYNNIKDHTERFYKTHEVLLDWLKLTRNEKIKRITDSLPILEHNINISSTKNFYHEDLLKAINIFRNN